MKSWLGKYWQYLVLGLLLLVVSVAASHFLPLDEWIKALGEGEKEMGSLRIVLFVIIYAVSARARGEIKHDAEAGDAALARHRRAGCGRP